MITKETLEQWRPFLEDESQWEKFAVGQVEKGLLSALDHIDALEQRLNEWTEYFGCDSPHDTFIGRDALIGKEQARANALEQEKAIADKLRVHCEICGGDYAATGVEVGCSCILKEALRLASNSIPHGYSIQWWMDEAKTRLREREKERG